MFKKEILLLIFYFYGNSVRAENYQTLSEKDLAIVESTIDSSIYYSDIGNYLNALEWASRASNFLPQLKSNPHLKEEIHHAFARPLNAIGAQKDALLHWHQVIFYRKRAQGFHDLKCALKYGDIGTFFLQNQNKDSCFRAFKKCLHITQNIGNIVYTASSWNNLGMAYDVFGPKDSALICYFKALEIVEDEQHSSLPIAILDNIAQHYSSLGKNDQAAFFYRKGLQYLKHLPDLGTYYKARYYISLVHHTEKTGSLHSLSPLVDTAKNLVLQLEDGLSKYQMLIGLIDIQLRNHLGSSQALQLEKSEVLTLANSELMGQMKRSIEGLAEYKEAVIHQQSKINDFELQRREREITDSKRHFKIRLAILGTLSLLMVILVLLIYYMNRKRTKQLTLEKKMSVLEAENERLKQMALQKELESKKSDLVDLALDNSRKLELNKSMMTKLKEIQDSDNLDINHVIKKLEIEFNQQNSAESRIITLQSNVDKVNQAFYQNIRDQFNHLTQGELELCGFIRLKLTGKEIANLRNVNPESITKAKQRLRKKLQLEPNADLYSFIESF